MQGLVYILTNPSFREDWVKIGFTENLRERLKELDNTSIPLPFEVYATLKVEKFKEAEKIIHYALDTCTTSRIRKNREFFNITPELAYKVLEAQSLNPLLGETILERWENGKPITSRIEDEKPVSAVQPIKKQARVYPTTKRPCLKLSDIGISAGEYLTFIEGDVRVKVVDDSHVEYMGKLYTLSGFARDFMPDNKKHRCGTYQGSIWFKYNGKLVQEIRDEFDGIIKPKKKEEPKQRRGKTHFSNLGINVGDELVYVKDGTKVKVVNDSEIECNGVRYTLTSFVKTHMEDEKRYPSDKYRGTLYFTYNGKLLTDLRENYLSK